jgi:hypothetical protein
LFVSPDPRHPRQCISTFARSLSRSRFTQTGALTLGVSGAPHTRFFLRYYFLRFGGGRPLHNVQCLLSCNSLGIPFACFANSSSRVILRIL